MSTASTSLQPGAEAVRAFYEQYPYPAYSSPVLRTGFDARYVASFAQHPRPARKTRQILDAGCGRGVGLVTCGTLHPDSDVLGIDLCGASLQDARTEIKRRKLANTRVAEVDLMTLHGLQVPDGGFDVIYSSGVVHHLSDPLTGLTHLSGVLAPTGVLVFMVYGTIGRRQIKRVSRALAAWLDGELPLPEQVAQARMFVEQVADALDPDCPWQAASTLPDAEFVDRYLHPLETDYDVAGFFDLIEGAGLRFLRWCVPEQWDIEQVLPPGPLRDSIEALPDRERYTVIEQITRPANLQAFLCKPENGPRHLPPIEQWPGLLFAVNPEVHMEVGRRSLWRGTRVESVAFQLRKMERQELPLGSLSQAALILSSQGEPFRGEALLQALIEDGYSASESLEALQSLIQRELCYLPHEVELE